MKKVIVFLMVITALVLLPLGLPRAYAVATGPTFGLTPASGSFASGETLTLKVINNTASSVSVGAVVFNADISPSTNVSAISFNTTAAEGDGWGFPSKTYSAGAISIQGSRSGFTTIAAGSSYTLATFTLTVSGSFSIAVDINNSNITGTGGTSIYDDVSQTEAFNYTVTGGTTTTVTTATTTVATTTATGLAGTGPADTIGGAFAVALACVSGFFFVRRARKAWILSNKV